MEDANKLIEFWGRDKNRKSRIKRRRIIWISILSFIAVLLIVFGFYFFTDAISKPVATINSNPVAGDWPMFGRDLAHSGNTGTTGLALQGSVKTVLTAGNALHSSPAIANGILYVGSRNGKLYAIEENTGNKIWEFQTGSFVDSSPAISNGTVYFGSNDGHLYALDAKTGAKLWAFPTKYPVKSSPAVADGKVYFGCEDYAVYAVNAVTGKQVWKVVAGDTISSSPVVANGIVYAGSSDGKLYAIDARSGRVRLKFATNRPIIASPAVVDDKVYINTSNGNIYGVNGNAKNWLWEHKIRPNWQVLYVYGAAPAPPPASGFLWGVQLPGSTSSSPAVAGNSLYLGMGTKLVSIDIETQKTLWEYKSDALFSTIPLVINNVVYATNENGHFYALDAANGQKLADIPVGGKITSNPVASGSTVYVSSEDGNLYAIN